MLDNLLREVVPAQRLSDQGRLRPAPAERLDSLLREVVPVQRSSCQGRLRPAPAQRLDSLPREVAPVQRLSDRGRLLYIRRQDFKKIYLDTIFLDIIFS